MAEDGAFADARVAHAHLAKLLLHALHHLVHPSDAAGVFPKRQYAGVAAEHLFEVALKNQAAVELLGVGVVGGGDRRDAQRAVGLVAVERAAVALVVVAVEGLEPARQRFALGRRFARGVGEGLANCLGDFGTACIGIPAQRVGPTRVERSQDVHPRKALLVNGRTEGRPRILLLRTHLLLRFLPKGFELFFRGRTLLLKEQAHLANAVVFRRPRETLGRFVAFVRTGGAVALRLGHLLHVHKHGNVFFAATSGRLLVGGDQAGVIPTLHTVNDETVRGLLALETGEGR